MEIWGCIISKKNNNQFSPFEYLRYFLKWDYYENIDIEDIFVF